MAKTLFPHQEYAISWMLQREADKEASGGLLCDEMGLGKTITTLGLMLKSRVPRTLILGPLAVIHQWSKAVLDGGPAVFERIKNNWVCKGGSIVKGRVYITNYDKLISEPSAFNMDWSRIICDEAHVIRNYKGKKYKELKKLRYEHIWLLTGTPIVNSKKDLVSLVALFKKSVEPTSNPSMKEANLWMSQYALCRTTDMLREKLKHIFPQKPTILHHKLPFKTEEEMNFYRGIQGKLSDHLQKLMEQDSPNMILMLQLLLRLRQISVHPQIYINAKRRQSPHYERDDWTDDSTKVDAIVNILREDKESHGYVIFCQFKDEIALIKERLEKEEHISCIETYHGGLTTTERLEVIQNTQDAMILNNINTVKKHTILLAQIHSAGTGLNLQHMNRVIFTTPWWTAALMDQAVGRVLRMGQTSDVVIHYLSLEEEDESSLNIDNFINVRVEFKRTLCTDLLDSANHTIVIETKEKENS